MLPNPENKGLDSPAPGPRTEAVDGKAPGLSVKGGLSAHLEVSA